MWAKTAVTQLQRKRTQLFLLIQKAFIFFFFLKKRHTNFQIKLTAVKLHFYLCIVFEYRHWRSENETPDLFEWERKKERLEEISITLKLCTIPCMCLLVSSRQWVIEKTTDGVTHHPLLDYWQSGTGEACFLASEIIILAPVVDLYWD